MRRKHRSYQDGGRRSSLLRWIGGRFLDTSIFSLTAPLSDVDRRRALIRLIVTGSAIVMLCLTFLIAISFAVLGNTHVAPRLLVCFLALVVLWVIMERLKRGLHVQAAWMLIGMFAVLAAGLMIAWGITNTVAILIFAFIIILSGAIVGVRAILPVTLGIILLLIGVQLVSHVNLAYFGVTLYAKASSFGDVAGFSLLFSIIALVSWLSGRQMEYALRRALAAEKALENEKQLLAVRLEEKTKSLREVQLEEMRQLYRFAELGQLGTVVIHELANYLAALTLDIDDIERQTDRSQAVDRVKQSITYLDAIVRQVRHRLSETVHEEIFSVEDAINDVVAQVADKAEQLSVQFHVVSKNKYRTRMYGDPLRFVQIMTVIITNAIESYEQTSDGDRRVTISYEKSKRHFEITVTDTGVGISAKRRADIFMPFHSNKKYGMGVGLFIAKEMVERHFSGSIALLETTIGTSFQVTLPLKKRRAAA